MTIPPQKFIDEMQQGYPHQGAHVVLGCAMYDGRPVPGTQIRIPLRTLNRHGLIAGATGTGKTKSLQTFAEQLSRQGIPSLLMDIKGDLSGIAAPGMPNAKIDERMNHIGLRWSPQGAPVELLTLTEGSGVRLRATVTEFGPVLLAKILGLNDTQRGLAAVIFKYCDEHMLPLIDLADFKKVLQFVGNEGKAQIEAEYGGVSAASLSTILRKVVELEQQGADIFFGEPSFDVADLVRTDNNGHGILSILRVIDLQSKPKLFSTFMLQLLAEIYSTFPEAGDLDKPKLCIFIDEAHLVFQEASAALLEQIETVIKLIRSKGVGVYFITQSPNDIPQAVLAQLGLKIQHALRAFTAKDRRDIKMVADNYPVTPYYNVSQLITEMGIGEAFVTALSERGTPTPLAHTLMRAPESRMDILTDREVQEIVSRSTIAAYYNRPIDRESAYEILTRKLQHVATTQNAPTKTPAAPRSSTSRQPAQRSVIKDVVNSPVGRQVGRTVVREITRGLLGMLGIGRKRRLF